jgi:hypothetical protein
MALPAYEHNRMGLTAVPAAVTEVKLNSTQNWTITVPIGFSASVINVQVNNSRSLDPTQPHRAISPQDLAHASITQGVGNVSLSAGVEDPGFIDDWVVLGNLSSSAYVGNGNWRFIRLATDAGQMFDPSFEAYLWRSHDASMI